MSKEVNIIFGDQIEVIIPKERLVPYTKLYIAGPQGFMESTRTFHSRVVDVVNKMGGNALDPWKNLTQEEFDRVSDIPISQQKVNAWRELNSIIVQRNIYDLYRATGVIANLDGIDMDSGTAAEIGLAYGRRIPILGYRGDFRAFSDNLGGMVNIQVEEMILKSAGNRGRIITRISDMPKAMIEIWGGKTR